MHVIYNLYVHHTIWYYLYFTCASYYMINYLYIYIFIRFTWYLYIYAWSRFLTKPSSVLRHLQVFQGLGGNQCVLQADIGGVKKSGRNSRNFRKLWFSRFFVYFNELLTCGMWGLSCNMGFEAGTWGTSWGLASKYSGLEKKNLCFNH